MSGDAPPDAGPALPEPPARPLPAYLVHRYAGWRATVHAENKAWFRRLAEDGQRPRMMAIACCDSRVNVNEVFSAETGDIFLHRNIASLVPGYRPDDAQHGTSAAVEYAVKVLRVAHLIVIGHSDCGGVKGCHDMCAGTPAEARTGTAPEEAETSFIGPWLEILRPGFERVKGVNAGPERLRALEKEAVVVSLANLWTFPFVRAAVAAERLSLHGLWFDIGEGRLESYAPGDGFHAV